MMFSNSKRLGKILTLLDFAMVFLVFICLVYIAFQTYNIVSISSDISKNTKICNSDKTTTKILDYSYNKDNITIYIDKNNSVNVEKSDVVFIKGDKNLYSSGSNKLILGSDNLVRESVFNYRSYNTFIVLVMMFFLSFLYRNNGMRFLASKRFYKLVIGSIIYCTLLAVTVQYII